MSAARKAPLRAVAAGEAAPVKKRRLSITEAADAGDQRELLVAMRARIAKSVEDPNCPPRDLAALTRRLQDINRDIEALDAKAKQEADEDVSAADEEWDAEAL
jgi:hypothetical protein